MLQSLISSFNYNNQDLKTTCSLTYGMVWYGMVWYGMVWYGMVWCGAV